MLGRFEVGWTSGPMMSSRSRFLSLCSASFSCSFILSRRPIPGKKFLQWVQASHLFPTPSGAALPSGNIIQDLFVIQIFLVVTSFQMQMLHSLMWLVAAALDRTRLEEGGESFHPSIPGRVDIHSVWTGLGYMPVTVYLWLQPREWIVLNGWN